MVNFVIERFPGSRPYTDHVNRMRHYEGELPACWRGTVPHLDDAVNSQDESEENCQETIPKYFGTWRSARMRRQPSRFRCLGVRQGEKRRGTSYPWIGPSGQVSRSSCVPCGPSGSIPVASKPRTGPTGK